MHPKDVLFRALIVYYLWSLDDAFGTKIAGALSCEEGAFIFPFDEVLG